MYLVSLTEIQLVELLFWGFYSAFTEESVMNLDFIGIPILWVLRIFFYITIYNVNLIHDISSYNLLTIYKNMHF